LTAAKILVAEALSERFIFLDAEPEKNGLHRTPRKPK
jgi:hypothetical protein